MLNKYLFVKNMEISISLCIMLIFCNIHLARTEATTDVKVFKATDEKQISLPEFEDKVKSLDAPFNGRKLGFTNVIFVEQSRLKRNVDNVASVAEAISKVNNSTINQHYNLTQEEELPTAEALNWRRGKPDDSHSRTRMPYRLVEYKGIRRVPPKGRVTASKAALEDEFAYILPEETSDDEEYNTYGTSRSRSPPIRRRKANNRNKLPPDEDVYSLYSAGRPYPRPRTRARVAAYSSQREKDDTLIATLLSTGSDFLRMLNPFNLFGSSDPEPPPRYEIYHERKIPRYSRTKPRYEEFPGKVDSRDPSIADFNRERRRPNDGNTRSRYRNDLTDFTHDEPIRDGDNDYEDYDFNTDKRNYKTKLPNPRPTDNYDPSDSTKYSDKPSHDRNYDFSIGEDRRSDNVKYSNEILQNIDDMHTLDYLKEFPLREDLYIAKDGNIYLKETYGRNLDLYGLDMYGMEYPDLTQESKQYYHLIGKSPKKIPELVKRSSNTVRKAGRQMVISSIDQGQSEKQVNSEFDKLSLEKDAVPKHPHSNFALSELISV